MKLKHYLQVMYKRLWIIILLPLVATSVTGYISYNLLEPQYETGISLYILNRQNPDSTLSYSDIVANQQFVKDYSEFIKSKSITRAVIDELKLKDISPGSLAQNMSVSLKNDSNIIIVNIVDSNPERARDIANKTGDVLINKVRELTKVDNVSIIDRAEIPSYPIGPRPVTNILISFILSMGAALGIVFLIEYLDETIKTKDDVEKRLGLEVVGIIPVASLK